MQASLKKYQPEEVHTMLQSAPLSPKLMLLTKLPKPVLVPLSQQRSFEESVG